MEYQGRYIWCQKWVPLVIEPQDVYKTSLEELTRDQLREEFRVWNQPVGGSREQLKESLTKCLEEEGLDPAIETFEVEDAKSTPDPLSQILEKLAAADNHFANLTATTNQQKMPR